MMSEKFHCNIGVYYKVSEMQTSGLTMDHNLEGLVVGHYGALNQCFRFGSTECRSLMLPFKACRLNPTRRSTGRALNPTTKPVSMMRYLLRKFTDKGNLVLDLLSGLGPLAEACLLDERSVVVIERDREQRLFVHERLQIRVPSLFYAQQASSNWEPEVASDGSKGWERHNLVWNDNVLQRSTGSKSADNVPMVQGEENEEEAQPVEEDSQRESAEVGHDSDATEAE